MSAPPRRRRTRGRALEILVANRRLGRQLRRAAIHVVTTPADRLTWSGLEAYLSLAERGRQTRTSF